ncbi:MAG TPA: ATP synthase F1 subunit epsilon [Candidatus Mcinerneyibacterium sp.]|nr:ATP synthase F1 subunit epsilon [Candidatus Mcinerneyibacterium sp.]
MAEKLKIKVLVPEGIKYEDELKQVILPGMEGEFSVLNNHIPLITPLEVGIIKFAKSSGKSQEMTISGGICRVEPDYIELIVRSAEFKKEINLQRAKEAKKRAARRLKSKDESINKDRAEYALRRAVNRINAVKQ